MVMAIMAIVVSSGKLTGFKMKDIVITKLSVLQISSVYEIGLNYEMFVRRMWTAQKMLKQSGKLLAVLYICGAICSFLHKTAQLGKLSQLWDCLGYSMPASWDAPCHRAFYELASTLLFHCEVDPGHPWLWSQYLSEYRSLGYFHLI